MSEQEEPSLKAERSESGELTKEFVGSAIAWSFYHSQGLPTLQMMILSYIGMQTALQGKTLPPRELLTPQFLSPFVLKAIPSIPRHGAISADVGSSAVSYIDNFYNGFDIVRRLAENKTAVETMVRESREYLALEIIERDILYFNRRKIAEQEKPSLFNIPSHFQAYAVEQQAPPGGYGSSEYFAYMYADCKKTVDNRTSQGSLNRAYERLLALINASETKES